MTEIQSQSKKQFIAFISLIVLFFAALYFLSPSIRGSDQYWYEGDIDRVLFQDGKFGSNSVFPASIPNDISTLPRPWVQNKPVTYIVLAFAEITRNSHTAWLLFNTICLFAAAFLTAFVLKVSKQKLLLFIGIFVFFPLNFYLASQALPEIFILFLIAAIHYLLLREPISLKKILILGLIAGILICQRPNYLLLLAVIPVFLFFIFRKKAFIWSGIFAVSAVIVVFLGNILLQQHLLKTPSIIDTILNNVQGKSNMVSFLYPFDHSKVAIADIIPILFSKLWDALVVQFEINGISSVMFYFVNILLIATGGLLIKRKLNTRENLLCLIFIAIHFITVAVFYNQYRYAAAIIPSLFILNYNWLKEVRIISGYKTQLRVAGLSLCILMSFGLGYKVRKESLEEAKINSTLIGLKQSENVKSLMCEWNNGAGLAAGYCFSPNSVFYYPEDYNLETWLQTAKKLGATHGIIFSKRSSVYKSLKPFMLDEKVVPGSKMIFFKIEFVPK